MSKEDSSRNQCNHFPMNQQPYERSDSHPKRHQDVPDFRSIFIFGLIGATFTTIAVTNFRRNVYGFRSKYNSRPYSSWHTSYGRSSRKNYQEEPGSRYQRRLQEEIDEEMERVERMRRMESAFNRARDKYKWSRGSWSESGAGEYHQHHQSNDWYWKRETSSTDRGTRNRGFGFREAPRASGNHPQPLPHHYSILGLDRWRAKPYTDDEIKSAFRMKAKEFHPDQNQENKEVAEVKFKEIMASYEAIKAERSYN